MLRFAAKPTINRIVGSSCRQIKHQKMNFFSTKNNYQQNVPPNLSPFLSTKNTQRIQTRTFRRFSSEVKEVREVKEVQEQSTTKSTNQSLTPVYITLVAGMATSVFLLQGILQDRRDLKFLNQKRIEIEEESRRVGQKIAELEESNSRLEDENKMLYEMVSKLRKNQRE